MRRLLGPDGKPLKSLSATLEERLDEAARAMSASLEESLFGGGPESRVVELRRSVLGKEACPEPGVSGLSAWLPDKGPEE